LILKLAFLGSFTILTQFGKKFWKNDISWKWKITQFEHNHILNIGFVDNCVLNNGFVHDAIRNDNCLVRNQNKYLIQIN
jgi:hypothetical protein